MKLVKIFSAAHGERRMGGGQTREGGRAEGGSVDDWCAGWVWVSKAWMDYGSWITKGASEERMCMGLSKQRVCYNGKKEKERAAAVKGV